MILTYKIKHNKDFSAELAKAMQVAEFAIQNRDKLSTKYVSHFGLKSKIANQVLRKYGRNKKCKKITKVKLTVPNQALKYRDNQITIPCLNLVIPFNKVCEKINCVEFDNKYVYVFITITEGKQIVPETHIGVDLNTTGHCAVMAIKETGKVFKLGKKALHIHRKYRDIRRRLQKKGKFVALATIKRRESNIIRDLNHKISKKIIDVAVAQKGGVNLEKLQNIRKSRKGTKGFKYALHSWSYYQLGKFIEYKALLAGVPVSYVEPAYTSKVCSRCGLLGDRNKKDFKCPKGHVENADVNAAFNLCVLSDSILKLQADRDAYKGSTANPHKATVQSILTFKSKSYGTTS